MDRFLRAKHWQLFTLMFGIPLVFYIVMMANMIVAVTTGNIPDIFGVFKFFPVLIILVIGTQFGWFWSVGVGLQHKVPETAKMKVKKFKIFFFIPLVYMVLIMCFAMYALLNIDFLNPQNSGLLAGGASGAILIPFAFIFPLHLFAMFCIFYCLYFAAKTLKTAEMQKEVSFSDFAGEFFLIWFYPIGIWFIQPRINKIIENGETEQTDGVALPN